MTDDDTGTDATDSTDSDATNATQADGSTDDAAHVETAPRGEGVDDDLVERLRDRSSSLATTDPTASLDDLDPIGERLAERRVIALGEATHGTREFFQLKHRVIRYLVERQDLRVVGLEANCSETMAIDEYVVHGEGDPTEAIEGIYFWTWDTEAVLALVEWLRAFNEGRPLEDRVRFVGLDAQFTDGPADAVREYLADVDPQALADHRETLDDLAGGLRPYAEDDDDNADGESETDDDDGDDGETTDEDVLPADRIDPAEALVEDLTARFEEHEAEYVAASDRDAYDLHRRHLRTLEGAVAYRRALHHEDDTETAGRIRDEWMAETVEWALEHTGNDRIALWAHDEHVRRGTAEEGVPTGRDVPMGAFLADAFGDDYYALGFDFGSGTFQAITETDDGHDLQANELGPPPVDAATHLWAATGQELLYVDFDRVTDDDRLATFFDDERATRSLGAVYYGDGETDEHHVEHCLRDEFDGLCYVADIERARPIARDDER